VVFNFSQVISDKRGRGHVGRQGREPRSSGGTDLAVNETKADEIVAAMKDVPGVADLGIFRSLGQPAIRNHPIAHRRRTLWP